MTQQNAPPDGVLYNNLREIAHHLDALRQATERVADARAALDLVEAEVRAYEDSLLRRMGINRRSFTIVALRATLFAQGAEFEIPPYRHELERLLHATRDLEHARAAEEYHSRMAKAYERGLLAINVSGLTIGPIEIPEIGGTQ